MALLAFTGSASSPVLAHEDHVIDAMLGLFNRILEGTASPDAADDMMSLLQTGVRVTPMMWAQMKVVRPKCSSELGGLADSLWAARAATRPKPVKSQSVHTHVSISPGGAKALRRLSRGGGYVV